MRRILLLLPLLAGPAGAEPEHRHHGHAGHEHPAPALPKAPAETPAANVAPEILAEFRAIEALAANRDFAAAERKIRGLLPRLDGNPAAAALLLRNLAALLGLQKRYGEAAEAQGQALALNALPPAESATALWELGQYRAAAEDWAGADEALSSWAAGAPSPTPEQWLLLADVRVRLKRYAEASAAVEKAIAAAPAPKAEWYETLLGLRHAQKNYKGSAETLSDLIRLYPDNARYWGQLTGIYQESGDEGRALATRELMYAKGLLASSAEIVQLAEVLRYRGLPARAAELLQREMARGRVEASGRNLELLADNWLAARDLEKAAAALEKAAALAPGGELRHRLGQVYSELHDWPRARQALSQALAQGGLKNPGGAHLLLGLAQYRLKARDEARASFGRALQTPAVRKTAEQWLEHMRREESEGRG
jgi:tetratricopeptide (TPR) repeat protein